MRRSWFGLLGLLALATSAAARADPVAEQTVTGAPVIDAGDFRISSETIYTAAGKPVVLFHYFAVNGECAATPVDVTLAAPPAHGRLTFVEGAQPPVAGGRPLWGAGDPRAHCADRMVATRDAAYAPDPGFLGKDQLTIAFREGDLAFTDAIEVNVVKIGGNPPPFRDADRR